MKSDQSSSAAFALTVLREREREREMRRERREREREREREVAGCGGLVGGGVASLLDPGKIKVLSWRVMTMHTKVAAPTHNLV